MRVFGNAVKISDVFVWNSQFKQLQIGLVYASVEIDAQSRNEVRFIPCITYYLRSHHWTETDELPTCLRCITTIHP